MSKLRVPALRRSSRPASKMRPRSFLMTLGVLGVVVAIALVYVGYNSPKSIPGRSYYTIQAEFDNADNLTASYQVRIGGRLVGQVLDPRVDDGKGVVDLQLTPDVEPLLSDSKLRVRPRSPVGVRFVELTPGTKGRPLGEGDRIPAEQTSAAVQIDEALDVLDDDRRRKARTLLNELGKGFLSRGEDINAATAAAPAFLKDLEDVADAVLSRDGAVEGFISGSDSAAGAALPVREDIARGFAPEAAALRPFEQERDALTAALRTAPGALRAVDTELAKFSPLLVELERFGENAQPAFATGRHTFAETAALLREAEPGLQATRRTLDLARRAVAPTLGLLDTLNPVLPDVEEILDAANPILAELAPRGCDLRRFFSSWEGTLAFGDGFSNYLRFNVQGTHETIQGYTPGVTKRIPGVFQQPYSGPCEVERHSAKGAGR